MKWFRSNIRLGSRLALLALAVQFWMSFGHFHGGSALAASADAKRPGRHHIIAFHGTTAFKAASLGTASQAPLHSPSSDSDQDCAICAVMALADTMLDAVAAFAVAAACDGMLPSGPPPSASPNRIRSASPSGRARRRPCDIGGRHGRAHAASGRAAISSDIPQVFSLTGCMPRILIRNWTAI